MLISKCSCNADNNENPEIMFRGLKACGFDAVDYNGACCDLENFNIYNKSEKEFKEYFENIKKLSKETGLVIGQTHAPFSCLYKDDQEGRFLWDAIKRCVEATYIAGSEIMVIHPMLPFGFEDETPEQREIAKKINVKLFSEVLEEAEKFGVNIALENMPCKGSDTCNAQYLLEYMELLDSDRFSICVDTGHGNLWGYNPAELIKDVSKYISCIHLHDNRCWDDHLFIGGGTIDWDSVFTALKDGGYKGNFNLESAWKHYPYELMLEACAVEAKHARYLVNKYWGA